jgi:hypothetical protein
LTLTTSPMVPSFSMRSSRMISMILAPHFTM